MFFSANKGQIKTFNLRRGADMQNGLLSSEQATNP